MLWWQVIQDQRTALDKQQVELAVTGAAFAKLQQSDCMEQLLFHTRIFARFSPEQKVSTYFNASTSVISNVLLHRLHTDETPVQHEAALILC